MYIYNAFEEIFRRLDYAKVDLVRMQVVGSPSSKRANEMKTKDAQWMKTAWNESYNFSATLTLDNMILPNSSYK